jgi:deoxyribodipyrimidine photolyase
MEEGKEARMSTDPFQELIAARAAYAHFMKRYANARDPFSLSTRKELARRLDAAEQEWERGRTGAT